MDWSEAMTARAARPLEMPMEFHGIVHRAYSLDAWSDHERGLVLRRWCTWCDAAYRLRLPAGAAQPGANVSCMACIVAKVPDHLRGHVPPFESMG